jgi:hypothetical protein
LAYPALVVVSAIANDLGNHRLLFSSPAFSCW